MDICCKGSWCEFGTLDDHPLMLLELGKRFTKEVKPSCYSCKDDAEAWVNPVAWAAAILMGLLTNWYVWKSDYWTGIDVGTRLAFGLCVIPVVYLVANKVTET